VGLKERIGMLDDKAVAYLSSVALAKEDDDAPDRSSCLNLLWRWEKLLHQPFLWVLRASSFWALATIDSSKEVRQSAILCCSASKDF